MYRTGLFSGMWSFIFDLISIRPCLSDQATTYIGLKINSVSRLKTDSDFFLNDSQNIKKFGKYLLGGRNVRKISSGTGDSCYGSICDLADGFFRLLATRTSMET